MLTLVSSIPSQEKYDHAFIEERKVKYYEIDRFEEEYGHAINLGAMEEAARVLACPVKVNPPNWQHGRIIYAALSKYLEFKNSVIPVNILDIGTAKGFSALCLQWALMKSGKMGTITSLDVIDPNAKVQRNSVAEVSGMKTLYEILQPWPEIEYIHFDCSTGVKWLSETTGRIHFAFIDGKHNFASVSMEAELLARRQDQGDIAIFDDTQIPGVGDAVRNSKHYDKRYISILKGKRQYAICTRK